MSDKKRKKLIIILSVLLLLGIVLMAYPYVSEKYSESVRSLILTEYKESVEDPAKENEIKAIKQAAIEYNRKLYTGEISPLEPEENGYFDQLKVPDTEIMCYIRIPSIDVSLPVYHGIGESELRTGAGHMPQTSLPVGGENTHAVISAHSGMASSAMFTDIELLEKGDLVFIDILGETLTYQVFDAEVVVPTEVERIKIYEGKDILTLVTCTPINVNTHRLLVYCERTETVSGNADEIEKLTNRKEESVYKRQYAKNICIGLAIALIIIVLTIAFVKVRKNRIESGHINEQKKE